MGSDLLLDMQKEHDYLVCIDSDGCILDNMELKHKECFCPATVNIWELQGVSRYAREAAEFVNLYSRTRGTNRFPAIIRTLELTYARPEVMERGYTMPNLTPLANWCKETPVLGAAALDEYAQAHHDLAPVLRQAAAWSREVDANIAHIVRNIQPFPHVKQAIERLREFADIVIISATPQEALARELGSCGISTLVNVMAGQELGTKAECIRKAMSGRYSPEHVLKIGDAPGDFAAAEENGVLFHPIMPGREVESWERLTGISAERFFAGSYRGAYMDALVEEYFSVLIDTPPWMRQKTV